MFEYKRDTLFCEGVSLEEITAETGTPVYVYSCERIKANWIAFNRAFSSVPHLVCYALKANTNREVCRTLFRLGSGADVTSGGELFRAVSAGADPKKIVYAGVGKRVDEICYAIRQGILMFNVESEEELSVIDLVAGKTGKMVRVALRVNPDIDPHTHKHITTGKAENKFGIPLKRIPELFFNRKRFKNTDMCGLHCHIGSQITFLAPFAKMSRVLSDLALSLRSAGVYLKYINLGGGLGIRYRNERPPSPAEFADTVLSHLRKTGAQIILEPGRFIVGNSGALVTSVLYRKRGESKEFVVVDAGMTDLIRPSLYGAYHPILPVKRRRGRSVRFDVVGPICETGDFLGKDRSMVRPHRGELLAVMCAGAYSFVMSSQYNSRPRPAEVMVCGKNWRVVRKRETYNDLVRGEVA